jgi:hypothetical protein
MLGGVAVKPVMRLVYDLILDADGPWAKAPEKGKHEAAHVLQVYAGHYNPREGVSRPGVKTLAKLTHHKRETVRAAKRWLEDEGSSSSSTPAAGRRTRPATG